MIRFRAGAAAMLVSACAVSAAVAAVPLDDDSNEAQIMGYYDAALAFTPLGAPPGRLFQAGVDITYVPGLSEEERQTTFAGSKLENTNFTSVIPRPRLRYRPHPDWLLETGFFPKVEVFGVKPQMLALGTAWRFAGREDDPSWWVRAHYFRGDIEGSITCSEDAVKDDPNAVPSTVCAGGQPSSDRFRPETYGVEVMISGAHLGRGGPAWYGSAGYSHERLQFDTHFVNSAGHLDDQVLVARLDRGAVSGGVSWEPWRGLRVDGEVFYAPQALATVRLALAWGWGKTP
ncbi:MAG TPA: hypothetical protein VGS03_09560 [Candidatus Polarisedimenticolia bacterium]|jgi:hypothetical protein|nr:hypothetical protein [Candidatus Polarisedimenticolia bacterium]